ncbi:MAG: hypothetical protein OEZ24_02775 [Candidatus Bathyarchaeota archaeon]|nr:hypothetical protein [Candidatus Bathyarchaeota archaeon]
MTQEPNQLNSLVEDFGCQRDIVNLGESESIESAPKTLRTTMEPAQVTPGEKLAGIDHLHMQGYRPQANRKYIVTR